MACITVYYESKEPKVFDDLPEDFSMNWWEKRATYLLNKSSKAIAMTYESGDMCVWKFRLDLYEIYGADELICIIENTDNYSIGAYYDRP